MAKATEQYNAQLAQQKQLNKQQQLQVQREQAAKAQRQTNTTSSSNNSKSSNSFSKTVQCKKLGQLINQEIKTFNGMVCPIGWFPYTGW